MKHPDNSVWRSPPKSRKRDEGGEWGSLTSKFSRSYALIIIGVSQGGKKMSRKKSKCPVTINYGMSPFFEKMIRAGHYDEVSSDINEKNFPVKGSGKVTEDLILVHLNKQVSKHEVLYEMKQQGLRPAFIEHLLAFGAAYPEKQREFPIIALGSVLVGRYGSKDSPCLDLRFGKRELSLGQIGSDWFERCRFLAVRK
jgi:hypothetical protein